MREKEYALSLYEMAEYYSENFRLFNGFGKSAVVERIERVMKYKKDIFNFCSYSDYCCIRG